MTRTLGRIGPAPVDVRGRSPINAFVQVREKGSLCSRHLTSSLQKNTVMTILFFLAALCATQDPGPGSTLCPYTGGAEA